MITKAKMQRYETVRQSGVTNMFDVKTVMKLAKLGKDECIDIMKHYSEYMQKFGIERE